MKTFGRILLALLLFIWALFIVFPVFDLILVYGSELWTPFYITGALAISLFFLTSYIFTFRRRIG